MPDPTQPPTQPSMPLSEAQVALQKAGFRPDEVQKMLAAIGLDPVNGMAAFSEGFGGRRGPALSSNGRKLLAHLRDSNPRIATKYAVK